MFNRRSILKILFMLGIVILCSIIVVFSWNIDGKLIIGHDIGYRINSLDFFKSLFYVWSDSENFGSSKFVNPGAIPIHNYEYVVGNFVADSILSQKIVLLIWNIFLFLPYVIVYITGFKKKNKLEDRFSFFLIVTILYAINLFNIQAWGVFWRTRFSIQILLPLVFIYLYNSLDSLKIRYKYLVLIIILTSIFNGGGSPPLFAPLILLWIVTGLYFVFINRSKIEVILHFVKISIIYAIGFILVSSYWIIPYLYSITKSFSAQVEGMGGVDGVYEWLKVVSENTSLINIMRLQGIPSLYDTLNHPYASIYLENKIMVFISFLIAALTYSAILFTQKIIEKKIILLLYVLSAVGIFFSAGSHPPLGWLFELIFKYVPGFVIFRTAFYKFAPLVWFSNTALIAFSLYKIGEIIKNKWNNTFLHITYIMFAVISIALYNFPIFFINFFEFDKPFTTKVNIPNYVFKASDYLNNEIKYNSRILLLPGIDKSYSVEGYKWGYWGPDPILRLSTNKTIVTNDNGSQRIIEDIYHSIERSDNNNFLKLAGIAGINKILIRQDYLFSDKKTDTNSLAFIDKMKTFEGISFEKRFGEWDLYNVSLQYYLPTFYVPRSISIANSSNLTINELIQISDDSTPKSMVYKEDFDNLTSNINLPVNNYVIKTECILCGYDDYKKVEEGISIPYVKLLPDSILYFYIKEKEKKNI